MRHSPRLSKTAINKSKAMLMERYGLATGKQLRKWRKKQLKRRLQEAGR